MPRLPDANQRIRDARHDHILMAAAKVFARKGLAATKIADIAAAAQVSHGLVYHYFTSKEEIFTELVKNAVTGTEQLAEAARTHPGTPLERLRWVVGQMVDGARRTPEYVLVFQQAQMSEAVPAAPRELALRESPVTLTMIRLILQQGQLTGDIIGGDIDQLTHLFLACIAGFTTFLAIQPDASVFAIESLVNLFRHRNPPMEI